MSPTQELEFYIRNYEAKYPNEVSPLTLLIGRTAEELLAAFKLAKGKKLEACHFVVKKRKKKNVVEMDEATQDEQQAA
jgi:hypothetical protein